MGTEGNGHFDVDGVAAPSLFCPVATASGVWKGASRTSFDVPVIYYRHFHVDEVALPVAIISNVTGTRSFDIPNVYHGHVNKVAMLTLSWPLQFTAVSGK